jgi:sporulation protein YlmC with PRC-barrel domain
MKVLLRAVPQILVAMALALNVDAVDAADVQSPAAGRGGQAAAAQPGNSARQQPMYRGSKIIGANVRDSKNQKIGVIKDLVLDSARGEIAYVVVSFGGVTGMGRKVHPIPWRALQASDDGTYYILHADKETISLAPGFDKGRWPDMADQRWSADIDRYWNRMVGRGPPGNKGLSSGATADTGKGDSGDPNPPR